MDKNKEKKFFLADVRAELKKVTWPTKKQTMQLTLTVFVISLIVAGYVGIIDFSLAKVLEFVTKIGR
jgi:preprotein translocase subunit SecE